MPDTATSLHLHNVHELMLLIPVKEGFVDAEQSQRRTSYATRLDRLLRMLFRPSQGTTEKTLMPVLNFSENLQNLYHFNYGVVTRGYQKSYLMLSATFDSSWESYFHNLVDNAGEFLDAVFSHCQGFEGRSCADGYERFAEFVRENQVQAGILYTATPDLTTDDLRLLRRGTREEKLDRPLLSVKDQIPLDKIEWTKRYKSDAWQGEAEYNRLRLLGVTQFILTVWETRKLFTEHELIDPRPKDGELAVRQPRTARDAFDAVAVQLAKSVLKDREIPVPDLKKALARNPDADRDEWIEDIIRRVEIAIAREDAGEAAPTREHRHAQPADRSTAQHGILKPDPNFNAALLAFLRIPVGDPARFLGELTSALEKPCSGTRVNVGFTYAGLRRLGLGDETLERFPKEFQEGMAVRAGTLGDVGWPNHPDYWRPIGRDGWFSLASIDVVVVFHFEDANEDSDVVATAKRTLEGWVAYEPGCVAHSEFIERPDEDPFGFARTLKPSQPHVCANGSNGAVYDNAIKFGDVLLGHENSQGEVAEAACADCNTASSEIFRNGTFLVVRKLAQNGNAFRRYQREVGAQGAHDTLGKAPAENENYDKLPDSSRITHLRRANPRFPRVPRLVRNSFTYRSEKSTDGRSLPDEVEQGHMFMCYNADLAQQYETIQRWINGGNITGLLSSRRDPVAAQHVLGQLPISKHHDPRVPNVTLRWGAYFFVPSKAAIGRLAEVVTSLDYGRDHTKFVGELRADEARLQRERGERVIKQIDSIKDETAARNSWKQLFEEPAFQRDALAVWAVVRASASGDKHTPYGRLLGRTKDVAKVLENAGDRYSVREYHRRFLDTDPSFEFYLALDELQLTPQGGPVPAPYQALAQANLAVRRVLSAEKAFDEARGFARTFFRNNPNRFDLQALVRTIVGEISARHIGVPGKIAKDPVKLRGEFLDHFVNMTRYSSFPFPEPIVVERAKAAGKKLIEAYDDNPTDWTGELVGALGTAGYAKHGPNAIRNAMIVSNIGFVPPALSMLTAMLLKWLNNGDIENPRLCDRDQAKAAIVRELKQDATFTTMYRARLGDDGQHKEGDYVIVGIQSAYTHESQQPGSADPPDRWMFGGTYKDPGEKGRAAHACPMQNQALEIVAGVVTVVASEVRKRAAQKRALVRLSPLVYEFEPESRVLPGAYSNRKQTAAPQKLERIAVLNVVLAIVLLPVTWILKRG